MVGTQWRVWLRHCATSWKVAGSIPDGAINTIIPPAALRAWGRLSVQQKWVPGIFLGVKAAGAQRWLPYHHVTIVLKSGSLKLLETSRSVQVCYGIVFSLPFCYLLLGLPNGRYQQRFQTETEWKICWAWWNEGGGGISCSVIKTNVSLLLNMRANVNWMWAMEWCRDSRPYCLTPWRPRSMLGHFAGNKSARVWPSSWHSPQGAVSDKTKGLSYVQRVGICQVHVLKCAQCEGTERQTVFTVACISNIFTHIYIYIYIYICIHTHTHTHTKPLLYRKLIFHSVTPPFMWKLEVSVILRCFLFNSNNFSWISNNSAHKRNKGKRM